MYFLDPELSRLVATQRQRDLACEARMRRLARLSAQLSRRAASRRPRPLATAPTR